MLQVEFDGLTGHIQFDGSGQRDQFSIFMTECSGYDYFQV